MTFDERVVLYRVVHPTTCGIPHDLWDPAQVEMHQLNQDEEARRAKGFERHVTELAPREALKLIMWRQVEL